MQNTLFSTFNEEEAVQKLRELGYRVYKVEYKDARGVSKLRDLVEFFYARRSFYNQGDRERKFPESVDYSGDQRYLDSFVRSRQKLGLSRAMAIRESAHMIEAMFKNEDALELKNPILSPSILTQRWFIDKLAGMLNGENQKANDLETDRAVQEWNDWYNKNYAEQELADAKERCAKILEGLNDSRK